MASAPLPNPNDYDAAQALDRLYLQTERWYDLLAILEREAEMAPMTTVAHDFSGKGDDRLSKIFEL